MSEVNELFFCARCGQYVASVGAHLCRPLPGKEREWTGDAQPERARLSTAQRESDFARQIIESTLADLLAERANRDREYAAYMLAVTGKIAALESALTRLKPDES